MPEQASAAFEKLQAVTDDEAIFTVMGAEIEAASNTPCCGRSDPQSKPILNSPPTSLRPNSPSTRFPPMDQNPRRSSNKLLRNRRLTLRWRKRMLRLLYTMSMPGLSLRNGGNRAIAIASPAPGVLQEFVSDLESSLGDNFLPGTISHEAEPAPEHAGAGSPRPEHKAQPELEPIGNSAPTSFGVPQAESSASL